MTCALGPGNVLKYSFRGYCLNAELDAPNVRFWLKAEVIDMPPERLLSPQERTFKNAMSALYPISSALPPGADVLKACARFPVLTQAV